MNDDGVAAQCACRKRLERLRGEFHSLAQQAGFNAGEIAAQVDRSPATVSRWFHEPDLQSAERIGLLVQVCLDYLHRDGRQSTPEHLGEVSWWREQLQMLHTHVLFGTCIAEPPGTRIHTRLLVKVVTPIVRQVPMVTSMMAVVLLTYALVAVTVGPDVPVRRSPSAVSSAEASDQNDGDRREPPAADRTGRAPLLWESSMPAYPDFSDSLADCHSLSAEYYDGIVVLVLCPGRGVAVLCFAVLPDKAVRRPEEAAQAIGTCQA